MLGTEPVISVREADPLAMRRRKDSWCKVQGAENESVYAEQEQRTGHVRRPAVGRSAEPEMDRNPIRQYDQEYQGQGDVCEEACYEDTAHLPDSVDVLPDTKELVQRLHRFLLPSWGHIESTTMEQNPARLYSLTTPNL